jgi:hypothetical protein
MPRKIPRPSAFGRPELRGLIGLMLATSIFTRRAHFAVVSSQYGEADCRPTAAAAQFDVI